MTIVEFVTIVALFAGPIAAHVWHKWYDRQNSGRGRRRMIFLNLMATRATPMSNRHVDALNAIDVEFSGDRKGDGQVTDAWHLYLDVLNQSWPDGDKPAAERLLERRNDRFNDLLYVMSGAVGYSFDRLELKNRVYRPQGHIAFEDSQAMLRQYMIEVLAGTRPVTTVVRSGDEPVRMEIVGSPNTPTQ